MSAQIICQKTISIFLVTLTHLMLTPQSTIANPANLQSLSILHPTVTPNWLSMGKFLFCLPLSQKQSPIIALLKIGQ